MNFTLISSFPDFETIRLDQPFLGNQLFELQESELEPITWAAGLEMEGTYILNPLDSDEPWSKGLKQFYIPDINQIMDHIDKTYGKRKARNKYIYLPEAEVSGRKCAGVSIIKPDPKKSMLEIATDDPYTLVKNPMADKNDLLYYAKYLIEIQENSIRDLNEFYYKETLWKKKKKYYSIIPYPYAMSDRLKNARIILGDMKNTPLRTNYTGSYHLTLTLPFYSLAYDQEKYFEQYRRYINQFQWIEPLIVAMYTTADMRGIGSKTVHSRASYRILLSGWGNPGGADVRKFNDGLTRKANVPLYWRKGMNYPGQEKLEKYCADPKRQYNDDYVDPKRDLYDMGSDFRTPSGFHGEDWAVRDRPRGKFFGVEMRILDYFPPQNMASLLRIVAFLVENSRNMENKMYVYEDKDWISAMHSVFASGWRAELPKGYIDKLEKNLGLKFPKKPKMLDAFWTIFLKVLYEKNNNGFYVSQLLPQMMDGEDEFSKVLGRTKQPPLVKKNPNRESMDFGILLKLNDSSKVRNTIQKTFQKITLNKKISIKEIKNHYKKHMPDNWKNNMFDLIYFFEKRDGVTIIPDNDGFIKYVTVNSEQNKNIQSIIENYIGSIVKLWPELVRYSSVAEENNENDNE
jgi:hypothetical protein